MIGKFYKPLFVSCYIMKQIIIFSLLFVLLISSSFAQMYADVEINIDNDGSATITGLTNNIFLKNISKTNLLTSKKADYWTFTLFINESFSNYIYSINLPKDARINYIKSAGKPVIYYDNVIKITEIGEDSKIDISVQYKIVEKDYDKNLIILSVLILIISGFIIYAGRKRKKKNKAKDINIQELNITDRQKDIIDLLKENNNQMNQHDIEKSLNIPKSSISRNIESLRQKKIINKIEKGNINVIVLNENIFLNNNNK